MAALAGGIGTFGVGDLQQIADRLAQPRRIHLGRGLHQHRLSFPSHLVGELVGALGQHPGMGRRDHPGQQGIGGAGEGPRNNARAVRTAS
jgi:hypothetical protein